MQAPYQTPPDAYRRHQLEPTTHFPAPLPIGVYHSATLIAWAWGWSFSDACRSRLDRSGYMPWPGCRKTVFPGFDYRVDDPEALLAHAAEMRRAFVNGASR